MCGICGIIGLSIGKTERSVFHNLLLLNYFRGEDSTGVVRIEADNVRTHRTLLSSPEFLFSDKAEEFITNDGSKTDVYDKPLGFIGHCRAATKGLVKVENAHPFSFENVVGVHNGTLKSSFKGSHNYDTDSEAIYSLMNGTEDIKEVINEINKHDSAYVLVWVDTRNSTVNIIKNSQRTLWMTFIYGRTALVFSSEKEHLKLALKKMGLQSFSGITPTDNTDSTSMFQLKSHMHMQIPIGEPVKNFTVTDLEIPEKTQSTSVITYGYGSYGSYGETYTGGFSSDKALYRGPDGVYRDKEEHWKFMKAHAAKEQTDKEAKPGGYGNFHEKEKGKLADLTWLNKPLPKTKSGDSLGSDGGVPVSNKELEYKLSCGCLNCGIKVTLEDYQKTKDTLYPAAHWYTRDYYACHECYENSPGDWVKYAIAGEDDSDGVVPAVGVSVH